MIVCLLLSYLILCDLLNMFPKLYIRGYVFSAQVSLSSVSNGNLINQYFTYQHLLITQSSVSPCEINNYGGFLVHRIQGRSR